LKALQEFLRKGARGAPAQGSNGRPAFGWDVMFDPVVTRYDGPALEKAMLEFWRRENVFDRVLKQSQERPRFVFYEGPPTANGRPGIHHVLARTFKDLYPRYKTMQGFYCPRKAGWDTHGLP